MPRTAGEKNGECLCARDVSEECSGVLRELTSAFIKKRPLEVVALWDLRPTKHLCDRHYKTLSRSVRRTVLRPVKDSEDEDDDVDDGKACDALTTDAGSAPPVATPARASSGAL
jgi:hypothetical protein